MTDDEARRIAERDRRTAEILETLTFDEKLQLLSFLETLQAEREG